MIASRLKKRKRDKPTIYRPMLILSYFSKVCQKIIDKRLISGFDKGDVIKKTQYGFQRNVSTNHAIIDVVYGMPNPQKCCWM